MISNIRHMFASPKIREYWKDSAKIRRNVYVDGTQELGLAKVADAVWREYESLLACSVDHSVDLNDRGDNDVNTR